MFNHQEIWDAIDRLAQGFGLSTSGLAKKAGLDPTSFNKSKRYSPEGKPRWPSTESLAKILSVTNSSMTDLAALIHCTPADQSDATSFSMRSSMSSSGVNAVNSAHNKTPTSMTLPLIGWAQAGNDGFFDDQGYPTGEGWDQVDFPFLHRPFSHQDDTPMPLYGLEVQGDSMQPLFRAGDILVITPGAQIRRHDRVAVKIKSGEVMAKELSRQTASRVELSSLNPDYPPRILSPDDIIWMARIAWVSQ